MFWSKNKNKIKNFLLKSFNFHVLKNRCILHGQVFVMIKNFASDACFWGGGGGGET